MRKKSKDYIITLTDYGFKVEAWDNYGKYISVSTKTRQEASDFIMSWWDKSEENKENDELHHKDIAYENGASKESNLSLNIHLRPFLTVNTEKPMIGCTKL